MLLARTIGLLILGLGCRPSQTVEPVPVQPAPVAQRQSPAERRVSDDPAAVARVFYSLYLELAISGLPDERAMDQLGTFIHPELRALLDRARRIQASVPAVVDGQPYKPPWADSELFCSLAEGATEFAIAETSVDGDSARVVIDFAHESEISAGERAEWRDELLLLRHGRSWLIRDVVYRAEWAGGDPATLSQALEPPPHLSHP